LDNLTELNLLDTNLQVLTPKIGALVKLCKLILTGNKLQDLPEELYKLTNLNELDLRGNRISHISQAIGNLAELTKLDLSSNQIESLPPEICQLSRLTSLNLSENALINLPPDICKLTSLKEFYVYGNKLPQDCDEFIYKGQIKSQLEFFSIYFQEDAKRKKMNKVNKEKFRDNVNISDRKHIVVFSALNEEIEKVKDSISAFRFPLKLIWSDHNTDGLAYSKAHLYEEYDLIAISPNLMGLTETAIVATTSFRLFKPLLTVMIGICAGRHDNKVQLGHIIVPDKAFHYQYGAQTALKLEPEILCENVNTNLYTMAQKMKTHEKFDFWMRENLQRSTVPKARCDCHIGPMASSDLVAKWDHLLEHATSMDRKVIGLDMESYAFLRSASKCGFLNCSFIIKCVTDYADKAKDDQIREWAQIVPARFFYFMIAYWLDHEIKSNFFNTMIMS
jgi:nucleoside phosphorylase